jgi:hypothetical protein
MCRGKLEWNEIWAVAVCICGFMKNNSYLFIILYRGVCDQVVKVVDPWPRAQLIIRYPLKVLKCSDIYT